MSKNKKSDLSDKNMNEITAALQKRYGKECVLFLNERPQKVDVIPTGSLLLNKALGIGGFPRGRIVEIYGPQMTGKCLPESTYIATAQGLLTIKEIMDKSGIAIATSGSVEKKISLLNRFDLYEDTKRFVFNGKKDILKIRTKSGHVISSTANHPHLVFELYDKLSWIESSQIKTGHYLVCPRRNNYVAAHKTLGTLDIFYVLGAMLNPKKVLPDSVAKYGISQAFNLVSGSMLSTTIPSQVRMLPKNLVAEFIKGQMDSLGNITDENNFQVSAGNWEMLYQVKLILQIYFGIVSVLTKGKDVWLLTIAKRDLPALYTRIGTAKKDREEQFLGIFRTINQEEPEEEIKGEDPIISVLNGVNYKYFSKINTPVDILKANYYYDMVTSVEKAPPELTYDFEMEYSHSFVANGVITHNTTLALHTIAEAQKKGSFGAFIDAEHSLDLQLAKKIGVKEDKLIISQPDYGEQGLAILEYLVKSRKIDIAVVDSVAALVPKAEIDGEMEDQQMGLQARIMGKALRKLIGIASKSNTLIIFINQIRQKIGGFGFGPNEITPGGNALKFLSSVRIDIRAIGQIKRQDRVIGNEVKIKITKNKLAPPFRSIETKIIFGKGFYKELELVEQALALDILDQQASTIKYGDEILGKGVFVVSEFLEKNRDAYKTILSEVRKAEGNCEN
jgi:recombination protein RecA